MRYEFELRGVAEFMGALDVAPLALDVANHKAMEKSVIRVEMEAKSRVPRRTGRLFSSIDGHVYGSGNVEGRVGTNVYYARFVEFGTNAHEIAATRHEALRYESLGTVRFAQRVHHPGTWGREFLGHALEESKPHIMDYFRDAAAEVAHDLGKD